MAPTINIMDGSGLSHKAHRECLPKKKRATCAISTVCFVGGNATTIGSKKTAVRYIEVSG